MSRIFLIGPAIAVISLAACANTGAKYQPITDGAPSSAYASDLQSCQSLATEQGYINEDTKVDAAIGAGIGALAGIADDDINDTEGAVAGAVVGAIAGAGAGMVETRHERKEIVVECMKGRGHAVVG